MDDKVEWKKQFAHLIKGPRIKYYENPKRFFSVKFYDINGLCSNIAFPATIYYCGINLVSRLNYYDPGYNDIEIGMSFNYEKRIRTKRLANGNKPWTLIKEVTYDMDDNRIILEENLIENDDPYKLYKNTYYYKSGNVEKIIYNTMSTLYHRTDGPALLEYTESGICYTELYATSWYIKGDRDPNEGPALITRYKNTGNLHYVQYIVKGRLHREDGPAYYEYFKNGVIKFEIYYLNGLVSRKIERSRNGYIKKEIYYDPIDEKYALVRYKNDIVLFRVKYKKEDITISFSSLTP